MIPPVLSKRVYSVGVAEASEEVVQPFFTLLLSDYDAIAKQGTDFASNFRNGSFTTQAGIISKFSQAAANAVLQLGSQLNRPKNERIRSARLLSYTLTGDKVTLVVELATADFDTKITSTVTFSNS